MSTMRALFRYLVLAGVLVVVLIALLVFAIVMVQVMPHPQRHGGILFGGGRAMD